MASWQLLTYILLTYSTGFSTEDTLFVETGASVKLNIQTDKLPNKFEFITWRKEKIDNVVRYYNELKSVTYYDDYKDRVEFNTESFSVTLKNMKKTDNGVYTAIASAAKETLIAEHRVAVIDAVEAPVLTVNSGWSSTGLCNFTCKADNITINTVINNSISCSEEVTSSGVYNLSLRCINDSIICNHSNPVSSKNDTKTIEQICTVTPEKRIDDLISARLHWLIPIICIAALGLLGTVVCSLYFYKNKKGVQNDTVYEEFEEKNKSQKSQEMLEGSANANTVYDTADKQPDVSIQTTPTPDSINQSNPKTIYCAIQKLPTPPASSSESDNTIYAVVNKHSTVCETVY